MIPVCLQLTETSRGLQQEVTRLQRSLDAARQQRDQDIRVSHCCIVNQVIIRPVSKYCMSVSETRSVLKTIQLNKCIRTWHALRHEDFLHM